MSELFDILNENGIKTGLQKPRVAVHQNGDWHRSVHVWIINPRGEVLVQKRAADKDTAAGAWDISCAGHISAGDDSLTTAEREIGEELGVPIDTNSLAYLFTIKRHMDHTDSAFIDNEFNDVYIYVIDANVDIFTPDATETQEVAFVPIADLEKYVNSTDPRFVLYNPEYREKLYAAFAQYFGIGR